MTLPPYAALLGLAVDPDGTIAMPFAEDVVGRPGFVHGGALGGLLEMAGMVALRDALEADGGGRFKPVTITCDYMRAGRAATTYARGNVVRLGRRIANIEASAWQDDAASPIAMARINVRIVRPD